MILDVRKNYHPENPLILWLLFPFVIHNLELWRNWTQKINQILGKKILWRFCLKVPPSELPVHASCGLHFHLDDSQGKSFFNSVYRGSRSTIQNNFIVVFPQIRCRVQTIRNWAIHFTRSANLPNCRVWLELHDSLRLLGIAQIGILNWLKDGSKDWKRFGHQPFDTWADVRVGRGIVFRSHGDDCRGSKLWKRMDLEADILSGRVNQSGPDHKARLPRIAVSHHEGRRPKLILFSIYIFQHVGPTSQQIILIKNNNI